MIIVNLLISINCHKRDFVKPSQDEIDEYVPSLPPDLVNPDEEIIESDGRFEIGMRKEDIVKILGKPDKIESIEQPWAEQEKWTYKKDKYIFFIEDGGIVGIERL
jgi:hypothetical protein